jgi:hypothetical protein
MGVFCKILWTPGARFNKGCFALHALHEPIPLLPFIDLESTLNMAEVDPDIGYTTKSRRRLALN